MAAFDPGPHCVPAALDDVDAIYRCVNEAYKIEVGDAGVAFKKVNRYQKTGQVKEDVASSIASSAGAGAGAGRAEPSLFAIIRATTSPSHNRRMRNILEDSRLTYDVPVLLRVLRICASSHQNNHVASKGCIRVKVFTDVGGGGRRLCEFGPFAVDPANQKGGVGTILFRMAEKFAAHHGATALHITVVNHRIDVIEWYKKRGFQEKGTIPFEGNFDLSELTRPSHFVVFEKEVETGTAAE